MACGVAVLGWVVAAMEPDDSKLSTVAVELHAAPNNAKAEFVTIRFGYFRGTLRLHARKVRLRQYVRLSILVYRKVHWLYLYLVWMVYILLIMGVLEAAADRTQNLRGAKTALIGGALVAVTLSIGILWFGPLDPFSA